MHHVSTNARQTYVSTSYSCSECSLRLRLELGLDREGVKPLLVRLFVSLFYRNGSPGFAIQLTSVIPY